MSVCQNIDADHVIEDVLELILQSIEFMKNAAMRSVECAPAVTMSTMSAALKNALHVVHHRILWLWMILLAILLVLVASVDSGDAASVALVGSVSSHSSLSSHSVDLDVFVDFNWPIPIARLILGYFFHSPSAPQLKKSFNTSIIFYIIYSRYLRSQVTSSNEEWRPSALHIFLHSPHLPAFSQLGTALRMSTILSTVHCLPSGQCITIGYIFPCLSCSAVIPTNVLICTTSMPC